MVANLAWGAEGLLELTGAVLFFGRRSTAVWLWLGFRFAADLACALAPSHYYQPFDYTQRHIQYFFFAAACTYAAWRLLRETNNVLWYIAAMCALVAAGVGRAHSAWPLDKDSILSLEAFLGLLLAAAVALALGMAKGRAPHPWSTIGAALVVMGGSDGLITLLRQQAMLQNGRFASVLYGRHFEPWYPLGAIVGLALLAWAGWRDWKLEDVRIPLGREIRMVQ